LFREHQRFLHIQAHLVHLAHLAFLGHRLLLEDHTLLEHHLRRERLQGLQGLEDLEDSCTQRELDFHNPDSQKQYLHEQQRVSHYHQMAALHPQQRARKVQ
jgi:hypothetical protein